MHIHKATPITRPPTTETLGKAARVAAVIAPLGASIVNRHILTNGAHTVQAWEDGRFTFVHTRQVDDQVQRLRTQFFERDGHGKVVRCWTVESADKIDEAGQAGLFDEPTELEQTEHNKALVCDLLSELFFRQAAPVRNLQTLGERYLHAGYRAKDAADCFRCQADTNTTHMVLEDIELVVGSGQIVASLSRGSLRGQAIVRVDMFNVIEGKVIDHWHNVQQAESLAKQAV